jgi:sulfate adenylyltransferase subunit 1
MEVANNQLLRFTTAGSVDDGKSTLIGRLLYDSKSLFADQLDSIESISKKKGHEGIDLALFTDGLKDEREQGITIDVAYRYFNTKKRKFIIADTPGHIQYTRNMVTGASTANAALILIDARHGVVEQTKRHSFIASLLQIPHIIVCVNKMDLVDYQEDRFSKIVEDYQAIAGKMMCKDIQFIPISALEGDNVVEKSTKMDWYVEAPLLHKLETLHISSDRNKVDARFAIQTVLRPQSSEHRDFRGYAGRLESGILRVGSEVTVLPSGFSSKIKTINLFEEEIEEAFAPMSIAIQLEDDIDVGRGDMIVRKNNQPECLQEFDVMMCWLGNETAKPRTKYTIKHSTNEMTAIIKEVIYKVNVNTLSHDNEDKEIRMNDILRVKIRTTQPLMLDEYRDNRSTGSVILIEPGTNQTVAAGMVIL